MPRRASHFLHLVHIFLSLSLKSTKAVASFQPLLDSPPWTNRMSSSKRMDIQSMLNPTNGNEANDNNDAQRNSQIGAAPESSESQRTLSALPDHQQQGQTTAPLPGQIKSKGKRQASNSSLADSSSPGLRRKRTKPNLKISPSAANSPFPPSKFSIAGRTPDKPSGHAPAPENTSFGLGIEGLSTSGEGSFSTSSAGPTRSASPTKGYGPMTSLASSFGQLFQDVKKDGEKQEDGKTSGGASTASGGDTKMSGTEEDPYDAIMASLETAEEDELPEEVDIGSPTPPSSPVIPAQSQLPAQHKLPNPKGKNKQPKMVFSIGEAIMSQNDVLLNVCNFMGLRDFFNFYCVSKRFYVLVNSHYTTYMKQLARNHAPLASTIFPYQLYKRACIRDPMYRTRPAHASDDPSTYINPVLNRSTQTLSATTQPITPANTNAAPEVIRTVPGLRWVLMCVYREAIAHDILLCLALEGHRFPGHIMGTVLRIWGLMDHPFNGTRLAVIHDIRQWSNRDIFVGLMFFIKLDMRFSDPLLGSGECVLRRLFMGQRSLVVLWEALRGLTARTRAEVLHLLVRWDCTMARDISDKLARGEGADDSVFGVPVHQIGMLCREGWRQGAPLLLRPDQLVLRESARRGLNMQRCFLDFMLWGYIDWTWLVNIPRPDLKELEEEDRKRRAGEPIVESGGQDGKREFSSGSFRAPKVSSNND
ncbi:GTP cyclohydrolase i [Lasiodiplodia theobromae]|uniref:GTP cyclohydrolase i n=1 Tax=Lasiodiplodia theobromae TaxID=45133 RepID=UPI0015C31B66|nr:GTP cyclohydrolase i [Lasiodiplodia theobromae]KAF4544097.1 GTP cyclohydrolase i [Lasiodiplodia theobromae]